MWSGKNIVILSPQPWDHIFISKHHYAIALARTNRVWFICAPETGMGTRCVIKDAIPGLPLKVIEYQFWMPSAMIFKSPKLYRKGLEIRVRKILKKFVGNIDVCIDFGCYQFFDNMDFLEAEKKIFFPVDDFYDLKISARGAQKVFSVSKNIVEKFTSNGLAAAFINHGLSDAFARKAVHRLERLHSYIPPKKVKIGYAGNLFIPFLDVSVFRKIISSPGDVEFHFYGSHEFGRNSTSHDEWFRFLSESENVILHGKVSTEKLAEEYDRMDGFIFCYKPDYKNYHSENSHKILEYLSTGKVIISTYLSIYWGSELLNMSPKDHNDQLADIFAQTIQDLSRYNETALQAKRIRFSLENVYEKHARYILDSVA